MVLIEEKYIHVSLHNMLSELFAIEINVIEVAQVVNGHKLIYVPFEILMIFLKERNPIHLGFRYKVIITTGIFLI